jgi:hypothetical protein
MTNRTNAETLQAELATHGKTCDCAHKKMCEDREEWLRAQIKGAEKPRPCRECGEIDWHRVRPACRFLMQVRVSNRVLDSERVATEDERHEFKQHPDVTTGEFCDVLVSNFSSYCGQPRDAAIHQPRCVQVKDAVNNKMIDVPIPGEFATLPCAKHCGHPAHKMSKGVCTERVTKNYHICGHRCATPPLAPPERCAFTCADFPMMNCKESHRCVKTDGHPFDPMYGEIHEFETHLIPAKYAAVRAAGPREVWDRAIAVIGEWRRDFQPGDAAWSVNNRIAIADSIIKMLEAEREGKQG